MCAPQWANKRTTGEKYYIVVTLYHAAALECKRAVTICSASVYVDGSGAMNGPLQTGNHNPPTAGSRDEDRWFPSFFTKKPRLIPLGVLAIEAITDLPMPACSLLLKTGSLEPQAA